MNGTITARTFLPGGYLAGLTLCLILLLGLFAALVNPWLAFQRAAIADGQFWRLLTAHWVHSNLWHLGMNLAGLLFCLLYFRLTLTGWRFPLWLLGTPLLVSAGLWFDGQLDYYLGLSAALFGLLVMALILDWRRKPRLYSLVLAVVLVRTVLEQLPGYDNGYLIPLIGLPVAVNAHLYGVLSGLLLALAIVLVEHSRTP